MALAITPGVQTAARQYRAQQYIRSTYCLICQQGSAWDNHGARHHSLVSLCISKHTSKPKLTIQ
jgi:hypothetical protein